MRNRSKYDRVPTAKMHTFSRKRKGEVPMPQLYKEIDEGYRYFLARRTQAMALGIKLIDLKKT